MRYVPGLSLATLRLSRTPLAAMASIGVIWGAVVASLPDIKLRIGANDAEFGFAIIASATCAWVSMAIAPWLAARSPRDVFLPVMVVLAATAIPLGLVNSVASFAMAMALAGFTTGTTDMLSNGRIADLEARHDAALMNLNHAFFSFAYAGAAILTGFARELDMTPVVWFACIGVVILALAVIADQKHDHSTDAPAEDQSPKGGPVGLHAWLAGAVVLVAFFVENSTEIWAALHIERTLDGGAAEGALGPAMLGLTMGIGRLMGHLVTSRGQEHRVLAVASWLAGAGLLLAAAAPGPLVAYLGFGLVGFGVSVIAPLALALAGQGAHPERRTRAVSRAMLLGYTGFLFGPPLLGLISESFSLRVAFAVAAVSVAAIPLVLLPKMARARA